jgi:pilus assembly protein Flp/PilA
MKSLMARMQTVSAQQDRGATAVEYGLMVLFIAVVIVGAVTVLGVRVNALFASALF